VSAWTDENTEDHGKSRAQASGLFSWNDKDEGFVDLSMGCGLLVVIVGGNFWTGAGIFQ
jgi:hypothetical protein